eukprot:3621312-Ditylum_brightwellii.AAC.1
MVLKGQFNSEVLDKFQQVFIQHSKLETGDKVTGKKITKEQRKGKVAKWHENTTTLPSGRHLGHFKALFRRFAESPDTEEGREMSRKREDRIDAHVSILSYTAEQRYSYKQ